MTGSVYRRSRETDHWQVDTLCPDGKVWPIDMLMYPLLGKLWVEGIETWVCCQGTTMKEYAAAHQGAVPWRNFVEKTSWAGNWCNVGIVGDPWPAVTLLASWGLPAEQISEDGTKRPGHRLSHTGNIVLDILAFREWCAEMGVADRP